MINYILLVSRQGNDDTSNSSSRNVLKTQPPCLIGKVRLQKWFTTMSLKVKAKIVKDVTQLVLARRTKMCNFLEYKGACFPYPYPSHRNIRSRVTLGHLGPLIVLMRAFLSFFQIPKLYTGDMHPFSLCVGSQRRTTNSRRWRSSIATSKSSIGISGT